MGRTCEWPWWVGGCTGVGGAEVMRFLGLGGGVESLGHQRLSQRPASLLKSEEAAFLPKGGGVPDGHKASLKSAASPRTLSCH